MSFRIQKEKWKKEMLIGVPICRGFQWSPTGELLMCGDNGVIYQYESTTGVVRFAGAPGRTLENGHRLETAGFLFEHPYQFSVGFAFLDSGEILLAEGPSHQIRRIWKDEVTTFAGSVEGFRDGEKSDALFQLPCSIVQLGDKLLVADTMNHAIRMIHQGQVTTIAKGTGRISLKNNTFMDVVYPLSMVLTPDLSEALIVDSMKGSIWEIERGGTELKEFYCGPNPRCIACLPDKSVLFNLDLRGLYTRSRAIQDPSQSVCIAAASEIDAMDFALNLSTGVFVWRQRGGLSVSLIRNFCEPTTPVEFNAPDLSSMLNRPIRSDLAITLQDQRTLQLHKAVLLLSLQTGDLDVKDPSCTNDDSLAKFEKFEKLAAKFRPEFVEVLAASLYGNMQSVQTAKGLERAETLARLAYAYYELGIDALALETAFARCLFLVSAPELVKLLHVVWHELDRNEHLSQMLAHQLRRRPTSSWALETEFSETFANDVDLRTLSSSIDDPSAMLYSVPTHLYVDVKLPLTKTLTRLGEAISWTKGKKPTTAPNPGKFRLSVSGRNGYMDVDECVLHSQWSWFRRMLESGLGESSNLRCELPAHFSLTLLVHLVKYMYTQRCVPEAVLEADAKCLLAIGEEFGLLDEEGWGVAPFGDFATMCYGILKM